MKSIFKIKNNINLPNINIVIADTFWERLVGLLSTKKLEPYTGLLLSGCHAIHMFGMRYALDIVYIDEDCNIIKIVENLHPWRISGCHNAIHTIELPVGTIQQYGWEPGMKLDVWYN